MADEFMDIAYALSGSGVIDRQYSYALAQALAAVLPWLDEEPLAGVHPLRGLSTSSAGHLLGGRSRLAIRVPTARAQASLRLHGARIDLPATVTVGESTARPLLAHPVLFSQLVVTGDDDEGEFLARAKAELAGLGLASGAIVGRRGSVRLGSTVSAQSVTGYSLMLHGLSPEESVLAQTHGLGLHRRLGCGLFVPHKSIAAVGS